MPELEKLVGILPFHNGRMLLCRRIYWPHLDKYSIFLGHMDIGKTPGFTASEELRQKLYSEFTLSESEIVHNYSYHKFRGMEDVVWGSYIFYMYTCEVYDENFRPSEKHIRSIKYLDEIDNKRQINQSSRYILNRFDFLK